MHGGSTSHSFCVNLTHFELMSHSSEFTNLDRSAMVYRHVSVVQCVRCPEITKTRLYRNIYSLNVVLTCKYIS